MAIDGVNILIQAHELVTGAVPHDRAEVAAGLASLLEEYSRPFPDTEAAKEEEDIRDVEVPGVIKK